MGHPLEPPSPVPRHRLGLVFGTACVVLAMDQLSKWWALEALADRHIINIVWTLRLRLVFNKGSAFGYFQDLGPLLGVFAVIVAVGLLRATRHLAGGPVSSLAVGSIMGGAVGNLADRVFRSDDGLLGGAVVDFIDVQWWPVWNVADMAIVVGAVALGWTVWRSQQTHS